MIYEWRALQAVDEADEEVDAKSHHLAVCGVVSLDELFNVLSLVGVATLTH